MKFTISSIIIRRFVLVDALEKTVYVMKFSETLSEKESYGLRHLSSGISLLILDVTILELPP
jgi:hypothetical protein